MSAGLMIDYVALWHASHVPPNVFTFLRRHADALPSDKLSLLLWDQQQRWQTVCPLKVEDYLGELPELARDVDVKLQLAVGEFLARKSSAAPPDLDEFASRFADLSDSIKIKIRELASANRSAEQAGGDHDQFVTQTQAISNSGSGQRIGRYRLVRLLGQGAFGWVWLGFDEELQRQVAIKVPTPERFQNPEDAEAYLAEARTVAGLDHAHIVPVYDVGRAEDGAVFVVSKFVDGGNLAERIQRDRPTPAVAAAMLARVAQALDHAHQKHLIHRDVKPANILIEDRGETPYVADFGLAIDEDAYLRDQRLAGTPGYMSPEQIRGEGHRLDGRSDIFSLGVVLYELLTGKRPFRGSTSNEVMHVVLSSDPMPPRQADASIPAELERICLKALSKRASDRYGRAAELADDLLHWQQGQPVCPRDAQIVPKGLRSFDANDAEFFLELLPGPRNRTGLPESIQFWKSRIEQTDATQTFNVGLIFGPSGCGKSSLVKAGLLPRLSPEIIAIYVEATADETESRIRRALRKRLPELQSDLGLVATFAALRRRQPPKLVVVVDQFEQWLHAHKTEKENELVNALRQCDGGQLQAVIMVRDDFSMAASRFMKSLEARIIEGQNFALVDLFDVDHAEKVLVKFGQAFGRLPPQLDRLSDEERQFLSAVTNGLAQDGKVVSVQLALLAEMVKGKPWVPATLEQVGGTDGIGVNFLEETFSSRTANPEHRLHQDASRAVLKALLPEVGTDIKGHMRSHAELLAASGYQDRPSDFRELLLILDGELRLITPTDPAGVQTDSGSDPHSKYYQLTHDFLVPSLREWLTRKQKETRRGRAELILAERSTSWNSKPENRHLPTLAEFLKILLFTERKQWTDAQEQMMTHTGKVEGIRSGVIAAAIVICGIAGLAVYRGVAEKHHQTQAEGVVEAVANADIAEVPALLKSIELYRTWADPLLRTRLEQAQDGSKQQLNAALALLPVDRSQVNYLRDQLSVATPEQFPVVRDALRPHRADIMEPLWAVAIDAKRETQQRFQAICALATYSPVDERWGQVNTLAARHLVTLQASDFLDWRKALAPAKRPLIGPLSLIYANREQREQNRIYAAEALADYAADQPEVLFNLLAVAEQIQFPLIYAKLAAHKDKSIGMAQAELAITAPPGATEEEKEALAHRQANSAIALVKLGATDQIWPLFRFSSDPRVRSFIMHGLSPLGGNPQIIVDRLQAESDLTVRRALVLMLGEFDTVQLPASERQPLIETFLGWFEKEPDPGLHGAVEWLLRRWEQGARLQVVNERLQQHEGQLQARKSAEARQWYVNSQGQTFVVVDAGEFVMGSPKSEPDRSEIEGERRCRIGRRYAISSKEITRAEFQRFQKDHPEIKQVDTSQWVKTVDSPQTAMTWYEAAAYCDWLSEKTGIDRTQWCYEPNEEGEYGPGMKAKKNYLQLTGYRLPTEAEWEYACRGGTTTSRYYGLAESLLPYYAWYQTNGKNRAWPTGSLKPNDYGLFDMLGNAFEWCDDLFENHSESRTQLIVDSGTSRPVTENERRVLRGGAFYNRPVYIRSAFRYLPDYRVFSYGFRPVRTYP